jgi:hypothetical protein
VLRSRPVRAKRLQQRDIDPNYLAGLHEIDGRGDSRRNSPQGRPVIRGQDDKSQLTARKILLILDILITGEQQIETRLLSRVKQRSVLQSLPSQFIRPQHFMSSQKPRKRSWGVGVEQSSRNRRRLFKGTPGEGNDVMNLLSIDRREPFQELVYG